MVEHSGNHFRTSDMVLATLLHMRGHEYKHEKAVRTRNGRSEVQCVWVFEADGEGDIDDLIEDFVGDDVCVDPREFARQWADVRSHMFAFLNG